MVGPRTGESPSASETFDRRYLLLGLVPAVVYVLFYVVLDEARPTGVEFAIKATVSSDTSALEAHYRYLWISAFLLSGAASLAVAVSCALSVRAETPARDRRLLLALITAVAALLVAAEILPYRLDPESCHGATAPCWCKIFAKRWYEDMGKVKRQVESEGKAAANGEVKDAADGQEDEGTPLYAAVFGPAAKESGGKAVLWMLDLGIDLVKALGAAALVLIGAALILTLARSEQAESLDRRAKHLAGARARQRSYLEQGATVYVFALIAMLSWMYWPLPFLADQRPYRQVLVGAAILQGVGYSLGIAAIYLPPALLLHRRVAELAREAADDGESVDDWLREKRLETRPLDELRQVAALLMPTLVSVLPALKNPWQ